MLGDKFNRNLKDRSYERAQGKGGGEMAAGAILGGLVGGPFGLLFGAQIGASLGSRNAVDRARQEEMKRLGITQDMLDAAEQCGIALEQAMEGLKATQESLDTHLSLARRLDGDDAEFLEKAKEALAKEDEEAARVFLLKRQETQDKLKKVLTLCAEEKRRLGTMEENVSAIEQRAMEVEGLLSRTVGAKTRQDSNLSSSTGGGLSDFSLQQEDPLLKKFRDMGID